MHLTWKKAVWYAVLITLIDDAFLYYTYRKTVRVSSVDKSRDDRSGILGSTMVFSDKGTAKAHTVTLGEYKVQCILGKPCDYPDEVDIRIIVLAYNRAASLQQLLQSLEELELDGDTGALEIWIDRGKDGKVYKDVIEHANNFTWSKGRINVHVRKTHVGLYGQWIDTWRPRENTSELALILEDDLTVSRYAYRWLKAAHKQYGNREDISGYSLQSEDVNVADITRGKLSVPRQYPSFMYTLVGSWGYGPHPARWRDFQDWYHTKSPNASFKPYVAGLKMTQWYKTFEKQNKADTMWTMWHIYYSAKYDHVTVYNNLNAFTGKNKCCLAVNRKERGLHYRGKAKTSTPCLLQYWDNKFINFPNITIRYNLKGHNV